MGKYDDVKLNNSGWIANQIVELIEEYENDLVVSKASDNREYLVSSAEDAVLEDVIERLKEICFRKM